MINSFDKSNSFLSNFFNSPVTYEGIKYLNNEAAFQSAKTMDMNIRKKFATMNPSEAKKTGRQLTLREDWEQIKDKVMYDVCYAKFTQNLNLKTLLLETEEEELVEGNWWHDNYWGNCSCPKCQSIEGKNHLGLILMKIRKQLQGEKNYEFKRSV